MMSGKRRQHRATDIPTHGARELSSAAIDVLRSHLGKAVVEQILRPLNSAVAGYPVSESQAAEESTRRKEQSLHVADMATKIGATARELLRLIESFPGEVPRRYLADIAERDFYRWPTVGYDREPYQCLRELAAAADVAAQRAKVAATRRQGRSTGDRHSLAQFVGLALINAGVKLEAGRSGSFARVLHEVYEAIWGPGNAPYALERDARAAIEAIEADPESLSFFASQKSRR